MAEIRQIKSGRHPGWLAVGAWLIVTVAIILSVTGAYVLSERTFYYWDQAAYQDIAHRTATAFAGSLDEGLASVQDSFREDYNALFALPLVPWLLAFGTSRLSFELALAFFYLVPLPLAIGAVAMRLVPGGGRRVFWLAVALSLLLPATWLPTLRGYPDSGAAALMVLAVLLALKDNQLQRPPTWVMLAALLGLAVVFRRHFAYAVIAFLATIVVNAALERLAAGEPGARPAWPWPVALRTLLVALLALGLALAVASPYVQRMMEYDFSSLYRSYELPLDWLLIDFMSFYGGLVLLLSGMGFIAAARSPLIDRRVLVFVTIFAGLSWAQWWLVVRQVGSQYTLHFTPAVVVGLVLFVWTPSLGDRGPSFSKQALSIVVGACLLNVTFGFWRAGSGSSNPLQLFAEEWTPLVRSDYAEISRLVHRLRSEARPGDGIFVAASSNCLNPSLLRRADRVLPGAARGTLEVVRTPSIDSNGFYPLNELLATRYVLLARPFQHHMPPEEQAVLHSIYDAFVARRSIAEDFRKSPEDFRLAGCSVSLFERQRPSPPATMLATLRELKARVPLRPGMQPDWVVVNRRFPTWLTLKPDRSTQIVAHPSQAGMGRATTFAALYRFVGKARIEGTLSFYDRRCAGTTLGFWTTAEGDVRRRLLDLRRQPTEEGRFSVEVAPRPGERVLMTLGQYGAEASIDFCLLKIDSLRILRDAPA